MTVAAQSILDSALGLSLEERVEIADALFASLDTPRERAEIETAWRREITARLSEIEAGTAEFTPWEEIRAGLQARLRARQAR